MMQYHVFVKISLASVQHYFCAKSPRCERAVMLHKLITEFLIALSRQKFSCRYIIHKKYGVAQEWVTALSCERSSCKTNSTTICHSKRHRDGTIQQRPCISINRTSTNVSHEQYNCAVG